MTLVPNSGFGENKVILLSGVILINPVKSTPSGAAATSAAMASLGIKFANQLKPIINPPPEREEILRKERLSYVLFEFSMFEISLRFQLLF